MRARIRRVGQDIFTVTLKLVPFVEGPIQGGRLNAFYSGGKVKADPFIVVPVQTLLPIPSFGFCPYKK